MIGIPEIGATVRILPPFAEAFPATYTITDVTLHLDGQACCHLEGIDGAFDPKYLHPAEDGQ